MADLAAKYALFEPTCTAVTELPWSTFHTQAALVLAQAVQGAPPLVPKRLISTTLMLPPPVQDSAHGTALVPQSETPRHALDATADQIHTSVELYQEERQRAARALNELHDGSVPNLIPSYIWSVRELPSIIAYS